MSLADIFSIAASGMSAQTIRLSATSSNLANADTVAGSEAEAYKARRPLFAPGSDALQSDGFGSEMNFGVMVRGIVESNAPANRAYEPEHPLADDEGYVFYSNVNSIEEMADMISASRSFQMNVEMINTTKSMMQRLLTLGQ